MVNRHGFHSATPIRMIMTAANATRAIDSGRRDGSSRRAFAMRAILPSPTRRWSTVGMDAGQSPDHRRMRDAVLDELRPADPEAEPLVEGGQIALRVQLV